MAGFTGSRMCLMCRVDLAVLRKAAVTVAVWTGVVHKLWLIFPADSEARRACITKYNVLNLKWKHWMFSASVTVFPFEKHITQEFQALSNHHCWAVQCWHIYKRKWCIRFNGKLLAMCEQKRVALQCQQAFYLHFYSTIPVKPYQMQTTWFSPGEC